MTVFRIVWTLGIYGESTPSHGTYHSLNSVMEDFRQCVFLQPENNYKIEASHNGDHWLPLKDFLLQEQHHEYHREQKA